MSQNTNKEVTSSVLKSGFHLGLIAYSECSSCLILCTQNLTTSFKEVVFPPNSVLLGPYQNAQIKASTNDPSK